MKNLSYRERQIAEYLSIGMPNVQIAVALGISPQTVKNYCKTINAKLGTSNRTEVAVMITKERGSDEEMVAGFRSKIGDQREEIETLQKELRAMTISRDHWKFRACR